MVTLWCSMVQKFSILKVHPECIEILEYCILEYRRHHPELGNRSLTRSDIIKILGEFYLRDSPYKVVV